MKKKLLIPFAVLAAFMGLSACGGNNQTESKAPGVSTSASEKNEIKITFSNANKKLTKGEKGTFTSTVEGVTWSSDNTAVATIDDKGEVTAVGEGKAVIMATGTLAAERKVNFRFSVKFQRTERTRAIR